MEPGRGRGAFGGRGRGTRTGGVDGAAEDFGGLTLAEVMILEARGETIPGGAALPPVPNAPVGRGRRPATAPLPTTATAPSPPPAAVRGVSRGGGDADDTARRGEAQVAGSLFAVVTLPPSPPRALAEEPPAPATTTTGQSTGTIQTKPVSVMAAPRAGSATGAGGTSVTSGGGASASASDTTKLVIKKPSEIVKLVKPPPVIKRGDGGIAVPISTNYVRINYTSDKRVYEYNVQFDPPLDDTKTKKIAFHKAINKGIENEANYKTYVFDGMMLFLPDKDDNVDLLAWDGTNPNTLEPLTIYATFVKEKDSNSLVQFFNIIFKRVMRTLGKIHLRNGYYDMAHVKSLDEYKLEIWPGFVTAIEEMEGGLMCCLEVSHRLLRTETVFQVFQQIRGTRTADWKRKFEDFIIGKIVLTRYNNNCYKITGINWDESPASTFIRKGKPISYLDYYQTHYQGTTVRELEQPLLLSIVKPRRFDAIQEDRVICLLPELCFITGLTDDQRSNFQVMSALLRETRLEPAQRKCGLRKFINEINEKPEVKKLLTEWNIELDKRELNLMGRNIKGPKVNFGRGDIDAKADFGREATSSVVDPQLFKEYLIVCTQADEKLATEFSQQLVLNCRQMGIPGGCNGQIVKIRNQSVNDFKKGISENLQKGGKSFQFLVCIMPQQREDVYSMIKKLSLTDYEVPSQCVLSKNLRNAKKVKSVIQRIVLQINCKLGGALWELKIPMPKPIMFVGIDVAHDALKKHPSVVGMVSSLNNVCTKYVSICRMQAVHQESVDNIRMAFFDTLATYFEVNNTYPERIVVFRDGGAGTDPTRYCQKEVEQMMKAVEETCPQAKFTFVVVQKRIGQRFFKTDQTLERWQNPDPGTIIDHTVTGYHVYDFYLVSQLVRQGTVTPAHYVVIEDNCNTKPELVQKLAYSTSYMYYNWPGTIRVPAVVQYAHKLSALVGNAMRQLPGASLIKNLYYL